MIPKALFLTFLSWRQPETVQQGSRDTPAIIIEQNANASPYFPGSNGYVGHSKQSILPSEEVEVEVEAPIHTNGDWTFSFDVLSSGDWDPTAVVNNSFKLESGTSARIFDVANAFPGLPVEHKHVWGAYPTGSSLAIKFVDGIHKKSVVRFGWIVNQKLATAAWVSSSYKEGKFVSSIGGTAPATWTTISNPGYEHDERRMSVTSDVSSGVLIVQSFTVDDPISSAGYLCREPHSGL